MLAALAARSRAHLEGTSARGEPVTVDLPEALLERDALTTGDLVWVSARLLGSAALVEVLPAVAVRLDVDDLDARSPLRLLAGPTTAWPPGTPASDDSASQHDGPGDDCLDDAERAAAAATYRATVAASLSPGLDRPETARGQPAAAS